MDEIRPIDDDQDDDRTGAERDGADRDGAEPDGGDRPRGGSPDDERPTAGEPADPEARALALSCAVAADDEHGREVVVLEVGDLIAISEYFVIVSGHNRRLVATLVEKIEERAKAELGRAPRRVEGLEQQQWVLMDYGDVVVHVFLDEIREFYDIERLYRDVPVLRWKA